MHLSKISLKEEGLKNDQDDSLNVTPEAAHTYDVELKETSASLQTESSTIPSHTVTCGHIKIV